MLRLLTLLLAGAASAADLPISLRLADTVGLEAEWALPPGTGAGCSLVMDPQGKPWLGCRRRYLIAPEYAVVRDLGAPYTTLAWSGDGLSGVSGGVFGVFEKAGFQARASFPGKSVTVSAGAGDSIYLLVTDERSSEVYAVAGGARKTVLKTRERVTAVTGDGTRHFVALGRRVYGLGPELEAVSGELAWDVSALEYDPALGLFYEAGGVIGYLGSRDEQEFLAARGAQIKLAGGALYVMPADGGVLRLTGLQGFARRDAALAAAE